MTTPFEIGALVQVQGRDVQWRGSVIGTYTTRAGHFGYVIESHFERGQVHVERARWVAAWDGAS